MVESYYFNLTDLIRFYVLPAYAIATGVEIAWYDFKLLEKKDPAHSTALLASTIKERGSRQGIERPSLLKLIQQNKPLIYDYFITKII